jgi:hypothetical protein
VNIIDNPTWQFVASNDSSICRGRGWYCLFSALIADHGDMAVIKNIHNRLQSAVEQQKQPASDESCSLETPWPLRDPARGMGPERFVGLGAAYAVASRPAPGLAAWLDEAKIQRNAHLKDACAQLPKVSMHMRTEGGRCSRQGASPATCLWPDLALKSLDRIRSQYGSCSVLVASDSAAALDHIVTMPGSENYHWTWLHWNRSQLASSDADCPTCRSQHVEFRGGLDWHVGFSMAADIVLLSQGDVFLGGFDSMVGMGYYLAMFGTTGMLPPYLVPNERSKHITNWCKRKLGHPCRDRDVEL